MSPEQTIGEMKKKHLSAMTDTYARQLADPHTFRETGFDERLAMIIDHELDVRSTNKVNRLVTSSGMYFTSAYPEDLKLQSQPRTRP